MPQVHQTMMHVFSTTSMTTAITPLKIYGRKNSSNVQKVLWVCDVLNVPYERIDAGGSFPLNSSNPEYLKLNPNGLIPTIDDQGFILWESNVIMRYLIYKYDTNNASGLFPSDPHVRAESDKWLDWCSGTIATHGSVLFRQLLRTPPEQRNAQQVHDAQVAMEKYWKILDDHLANRQFVAGDHLTLGDIPVGIWTYRYYNLPIQRPTFPNLEAWFARVKLNEPFKKHVEHPLS